MPNGAQLDQILRAMKEQTEVLKKIERHLRPRVADAEPIRRPNLQEPAPSVPDLPPGVEPMTEDDDLWHPGFPGTSLIRP